VYARLKIAESGAGYCHFPVDRDLAYFEQLTAEKLRTKYSSGFPRRYWWKPDGKRNEALDCRVYAYAALHGLFSMGMNLNKRADALPTEPETGEEQQTPVREVRHRHKVVKSRYL
jgi:phage terminase large subunit GpA-like protein